MADVNFTPARDGTSSASTSQGNTNSYVYDVFVNQRGPDVTEGLASHIYYRLTDFGLAVFLDQGVLERGEGLNPQIEGAIRTASVHVAIFSPNYAQSTWCLDELVQMLESGSTIIPVFYNVEPADLRWTRGGDGVYARALGVLERKRTLDGQPRYEPNTIEKWRNALSAVADINGFELKDKKEWQLVHEVVQQVLKKFPEPPLHVAKYPTGVDEKIKDLDRTLSLQRQREKATVLGIVGLGGVGKTTLAKQFFNRERSNYDRCCFLFDVTSKSLPSLQSRLLKDLSNWNAQINSVDEGIERLKTVSQRALIILDGIDHIDQMYALCAPVIDTIHVGSLILITSRNKDVLIGAGIDESSIYTLKGLNFEHSRELFCWHAFGVDRPVIGFEEVVKKFLHFCNGLPLSLEVIGKLLRGKHLKDWDAQFRKISKVLPEDIQNTLRISYDALDSEAKQIFLDIACFFIGEDMDTAIRVWYGSNWEGFLGLSKLENRFLVEVDGRNRLRMHDHVRDLGRDIAENPEYPRRLCRFRKSFLPDVVADQSPVRGISMVDGNDSEQSFQSFDQSPVRGITMDSGNGNEQILDNIAATDLLRLQLLRGQGYFVGSLFSAVELRQLIYLRWEECPISSISFTNLTRNLRVLYIEGQNLETLWQHESQAPLQLMELYIDAPLSEVPESIGKLNQLEKIVLKNSVFKALPNSFRNLQKLRHVDLSKCSNLEMLPYSFGNLRNLQYINLSECSNLQMLPSSLENLKHLQYMDLSWCFNLQTLPNSLGNLRSLRHIDLSWCSNLQMLPISFGNLTNLQHVNLSGCSNLPILPNSFGNLIQLKHLCLRKCYELTISSETLGQIRTLEWLDISGCYGIEVLPPQITNQRFLREMYLFCPFLKELPSTIGELSHLEILHLESSCLELLEMGELVSLEELQVRECVNLKSIQGLAQLKKLRRLDVANCSGLEKLSGVEHLGSLEKLNASGCPNLQWGLGVLEQLDKQLKGCIIK